MYISPDKMEIHQLIIEIDAVKEELEVFGNITIFQAEKMSFDPRDSVRELRERLDELMAEGRRRGIYELNFRLV